MALHFGKRENELNTKPLNSGLNSGLNTPKYGSAAGSAPAATPATVPPTPSASTTSAPAATASPTDIPEGGSKLTVGPNIKLKGVEITDCDTLFVEGLVEATMDSRVMQIAEQGAFKGTAEIDIAEIHGCFDGDLTVRQKLVIHSTGKVTGKIRYGKVVIEEGGQLSGNIECSVTGTVARSADKPAMALAA